MSNNLKSNFTETFKFYDWPNPNVPKVAAGVYAIWENDKLIYCGMSGRSIETNSHKVKYGLVTRLHSHQSGRLSGDQFCVYVANRMVIPKLKQVELIQFESGDITLDRLTKQYIHNNLSYQYVVVPSSSEAYRVEILARKGELFSQKPYLNPLD